MGFAFRLAGRRIIFLLDGVETKSRPLGDADIASFADWARRYGTTVRDDRGARFVSLGALLGIGREITAWLDQTGWMADLRGGGPLVLDIAVGDGSPADVRAFLDVPWEVMATAQGFFAADAVRQFCIQRRIGQTAPAAAPCFQSLKLMFMAASPRATAPVLDYEAEEAAILQATDNLPLALTVEESGCLDFLAQRLAAEAPFEALHLSCHGDIVNGGPKLILESAEGERADASAADIVSAFGVEKPGLVFLAACRTAEHEAQSAPLAMELLRAGVPSVLGWDGSVLDTDATQFAQGFYTQLARCQTPAFAAAKARTTLLAAHLADPDRRICRHWHMARLYAGPSGGGALCDANAAARPSARGMAYNAFLDKARARVPVAGPMAFIGRRREAQGLLRALLRDCARPGVLIHAIGGQGKSSLAARVADRLPRHRTAVVFGDYRAKPIFDAVLTAVPPEERAALRERWETKIEAQGTLRDALEDMLTGPCAAFDAGRERQPVLLVIDDLEQALEPPAPGLAITQAQPDYRAPLTAVIEAFDTARRAGSQSCLILTSRYDFALPNSRGIDLAGLLHKVALCPFDDYEQGKQQRAARAELGGAASTAVAPAEREALLTRAREAALGNPLIQATLTRFVLAEPASAEPAIREMEAYIRRGETRDAARLADLFARLTLDAYRAALSAEEKAAFRAMTLFAMPVPESALLAAAEAEAPAKARAALARFLRLGLVDPFEAAPPQKTEYLASKLARPLFDALSEEERHRLAEAALPALIAAWTTEEDWLVTDARALEVWRLARISGDLKALFNATRSGGTWLFHLMGDARSALPLVESTIEAFTSAGIEPDPRLFKFGIECARWLRNTELEERWLNQAGTMRGSDAEGKNLLALQNVDHLIRLNQFDEALVLVEQVKAAFIEARDERHVAVTMVQIARILSARHNFDEALRILREEVVPIFDRLGDMPGIMAVRRETARIAIAKGITDQETFGRVFEDLSQAYGLAKKLTRLDFICVMADELGTLLADAGAHEPARALLTEARDGWRKLALAACRA